MLRPSPTLKAHTRRLEGLESRAASERLRHYTDEELLALLDDHAGELARRAGIGLDEARYWIDREIEELTVTMGKGRR